jgi:hypothetical protein
MPIYAPCHVRFRTMILRMALSPHQDTKRAAGGAIPQSNVVCARCTYYLHHAASGLSMLDADASRKSAVSLDADIDTSRSSCPPFK